MPGVHPGHHTQWIQGRRVGKTPWGWRDAVVSGVDGRWVGAAYVGGDRQAQLWHHVELAGELAVGAPVRVDELYYVPDRGVELRSRRLLEHLQPTRRKPVRSSCGQRPTRRFRRTLGSG